MADRPLTIGELIDYLQQFPTKTAVFVDYGPFNKRLVDEHNDNDKPYILLDSIDFTVEE